MLTALSVLGGYVHAQSVVNTFNISISPAEPRARQTVEVVLKSFSININTSYISWILNGKRVKEGRGASTYSFETGALGTESSVRVIVNTEAGIRIEQSFQIQPAEVDLIWEAFTYVPAFYKGKALATSKSRIKITAIPHFIIKGGARITSDNIIYTWRKDRRVLGSFSGTGKQSIIIDGPRLFENIRVGVSVSSLGEEYSARGEIVIQGEDPQILFYEKHPTEGIRYGHALSPEFTLSQEEIVIRAEPYFFSSEDLRGSRTSFEWKLNNTLIRSASRVNEVVLRQEDLGGTAQLSLRIENIAKILQEARASIFIRFGGKSLLGI